MFQTLAIKAQLGLMNLLAITSDSWSLDNLLKNLESKGVDWGNGIIILAGLIMIVVAVVKGGKALMSDRSQASWGKIILLFFIGGAFLAGGIALARGIAEGGQKTLEDLGNGMIMTLRMLGV